MKKQLFTGVLCAAILVPAGCGAGDGATEAQGGHGGTQEHGNAQEITPGLFGPGPINHRTINPQDHSDHPLNQGEINNGTSFTTLDADRPDIGDDADNMHYIAKENGFTPLYVLYGGSHATVYVNGNQGWSKQERDNKVKELRTAYEQNTPRYNVEVHVLNDG
ncbi:hypothetical protein ACFPU1_01925 [Thalassorhabdus alkalitolerans]|uniref:Uncharacterized protein n=1 Tax=Thalassorhabdus alkalitolerans TaxID=2282697 RepID=A0ABW0YGV3_9BACI